jgi:pimeloyl-ACP methyl ester carboxylesterase
MESETMVQALPEVFGRYAMVDGTRVYYDQCGETGPSILCIHTAGACSLQFFQFIQLMAQRGYRAMALDLPGHGKSYPINWEPTRTAHDYAEFIWKLTKVVCPNERPIIVGSSAGGAITLDLACHHSEDLAAIVALEGLPAAEGEQWTRYCTWWEHPHSVPGWRDIMERVAMSGVYGLSEEGIQELRWQHRYCAQEIGTGDLQCWASHDVRDKLQNISCPTLSFKGEADYWVPEEKLDFLVSQIPNSLAEKVIGPGMGHYPMVERPDAVAELVAAFLQRRLSS